MLSYYSSIKLICKAYVNTDHFYYFLPFYLLWNNNVRVNPHLGILGSIYKSPWVIKNTYNEQIPYVRCHDPFFENM